MTFHPFTLPSTRVNTILVQKIHHVAYRCKDTKTTIDWYEKHLGMKLVLAIAENEVPSTKAPDPCIHIFLDAGDGNILAFFELPGQQPMGRDENTPAWVQHLALKVGSYDDLIDTKASPTCRSAAPATAMPTGPWRRWRRITRSTAAT